MIVPRRAYADGEAIVLVLIVWLLNIFPAILIPPYSAVNAIRNAVWRDAEIIAHGG